MIADNIKLPSKDKAIEPKKTKLKSMTIYEETGVLSENALYKMLKKMGRIK